MPYARASVPVFFATSSKRPPSVAVEILQAEVVRRQEVVAAVLVVVLEEGGERPARLVGDAPGLRGVGESAVAVVQVQEVRAPVLRVEGGVGHLAVVVAGDRDEEIEVAVAVDVRESGRAGVGRDGDAGGSRGLFERAVAAVSEEARRSEGVGHEEIGVAVAVDVARGEAGRRDALRRRLRETGLLRNVGEMPGAVALVENRAQAVTDEEVLGAVAVEVEHGDARPGPDVRDEVVDLVDRRVVPRRTEPGFGGGVAEARGGLDALGERLLEAERPPPLPAGEGRGEGPSDVTIADAERSTRAPSVRKPPTVNVTRPVVDSPSCVGFSTR